MPIAVVHGFAPRPPLWRERNSIFAPRLPESYPLRQRYPLQLRTHTLAPFVVLVQNPVEFVHRRNTFATFVFNCPSFDSAAV